jgi:hypothetical protein
MKRMRIVSTLLLCLLFAAFAYASPRQQDEPKSKDASQAAQPPDAKPEAKPETQEQKPDEMKPEKQEKNDQEMKSDKDQEKQDKDQDKQEKKDEKKAGKDNNNGNMGNMRNENQAHAQPAGKGGHIPDDKFRSSFGRGHTFHPSRPVMVNNQPTFNYGGYSFVMVDAWPGGWAYTDDCYIDYIDGEYFLFDLLHPGVRIELFVSM